MAFGYYSADQVRAIERAALAYGVESYDLMQRAGRAAFRVLGAHYALAERIVVLCGPGNNGGDGYVLARLLRQAARTVRVLAPLGPPSTGDARRAYADWCAAGGSVEASATLPPADLYVDALFGIGLSRAPGAPVAGWIEAVNQSSVPVLALDLPSGVDGDTGAVPGLAIRAHRTLSFIVAKVGLATGPALDHVGEVLVDDLQLPEAVLASAVPRLDDLESERLMRALPHRSRNSHKGRHGQVLIVGGELGTGGAVILATLGALRGGAGSVRVATREAHLSALLARCPEAMARSITDPSALDPMLEAATVVVLGPGLGTGSWGLGLARRALNPGRALVLDADALNLLASEALQPPPDAILTPHPGEAARLLGSTTDAVQSDRRSALQRLVERYAATVVLKGAGSMIGAPGLRPRLCARGNPGLAVAGSGDVLAGLIGALRAQGLDAPTAASLGVLAHAGAGDDLAARRGPRGMLPSDVVEALAPWLNPQA